MSFGGVSVTSWRSSNARRLACFGCAFDVAELEQLKTEGVLLRKTEKHRRRLQQFPERQKSASPPYSARSEFITDFAQQIFAPGNPGFIFYAGTLSTIDHTHNAAPLLGFGNYDFDRVRGGAKDAAHFGNIF